MDITSEQVLTLAEYCQFVVSEYFKEALQLGALAQINALAKFTSRPHFHSFLEKFREEMISANPGNEQVWKDMKSPYDTKKGPLNNL